MASVFTAEETLDPAFVPPRLVQREALFAKVLAGYRAAIAKGLSHHLLITGGIGSGKTAIGRRMAQEVARPAGRGGSPVISHYVNCWRRSSDRLILLELLRGVGVHLPDKGYGVPDMIDLLEQGMRRAPAHRLIVLDEVGALVRQETRLLYLLTRSAEVGLGTVSLCLLAPENVLPYLDAASRSSFGASRTLALPRYTPEDLAAILEYRAGLAFRRGSVPAEVLGQIAALAAPTGDARFALELLQGAGQAADAAGAAELQPEHVRGLEGTLRPTMTEEKLAQLGETELLLLLGLSRTLRGPKTRTPTGRVRQSYAAAAEEYGLTPVSRVTFWRTVRSLEQEGIVQVDPASPGRPSRLGMDEVPTAVLSSALEARMAPATRRKP
jgi:archaeal cell division control protein 6